jgi:hypothetical protein
VIFGVKAISIIIITITAHCRLFWTSGKINDFQLKGQKFKLTENPWKKLSLPLSILLSRSFFLLSLPFYLPLSTLDDRQEQTSGWVLTEFLKGYRAKRKIPTSDSCTRHTLPYSKLSTVGEKNTFNMLSTNRSVILFYFRIPFYKHYLLGNSSKIFIK